MGNPFVHVELNTTNATAAKAFYKALFDWKLNDMPDGSYTMIEVGEGTGGGLMQHPVPGAPSAWMPYVSVADVKAATAKASELGAKTLKDVTQIKGMGWFSVIEDPTGAVFGLWQDDKR